MSAADATLCDKTPAPANLNFTLKDTAGKNFTLASQKGKVILLDFWATWCAPCKVEIPWFAEFQSKYGPRGFAVIGMSVDDPLENLKPFAQQYKMNYPVLLGEGRDDLLGPKGLAPRRVPHDVRDWARWPDLQEARGVIGEREIRTGNQSALISGVVSLYERFYPRASLLRLSREVPRRRRRQPITVVVDVKAPGCTMGLHVRESPDLRLPRSAAPLHARAPSRARRLRGRKLKLGN
jgi:thiol-disulfide isomerase/thioredoxin